MPVQPTFSTNNDEYRRNTNAWQAAYESYLNTHDIDQQYLDGQAKQYGDDDACMARPVADSVTVAGFGIVNLFYRFKEGKLDRIDGTIGNYQDTRYALVREAIVAKYGPPTQTSTKHFSNKLGAQFTGEVALWQQEGSAILLNERTLDDLTMSSLEIFDPTTLMAREKAAQQKAKADF